MERQNPVVAHLTVHSLNGRKEAFAIVTAETAQVADGTYALVMAPDVAATETLAALKAMLAWSEEPDPESKSARTAPLMRAWADARAAIAKSEVAS